MAQFSKWIKVENKRLEFWFTEIFELDYIRFYVTVVDFNRNLIPFNMMKSSNERWEIAESGNVPSWILHMEDTLSNCINENYKVQKLP